VGEDQFVALADRWNHNIHYDPVIVEALPDRCERVLEVGCGEGVLSRTMSEIAGRVVGLDRDAPSIESARRDAAADNIDYVVGDLLAHPFRPASFDAVVANTVIHHIGTAVALERMRDLVRPGGVVAVVGVARSRSPSDIPYDLAGTVATRVHKRSKGWWSTSAPKVWPPPESFTGTRRIAARVLPGSRFRRHVLWRYSLVWTKAVHR
jgi:2-polyprenyl-3-methyl-5-hydroxy-6-metoxy-1,4-benzoquinol methylase